MTTDFWSTIASGIGNSEKSATSASTLAATIIAANNGGGGWVVTDPNITYTLDPTTLPASITNVGLKSTGSGPTSNTVISVTNVQTADNTIAWKNGVFEDVTFNGSTLSAGGNRCFLGGTNNQYLIFRNVWWIDWVPMITHNLGPYVKVEGGGAYQATSGLTGTLLSRWSGPLGPFWMKDYYADQSTGAVGFAGYSQVPTGPWVIDGLHFNTQNLYYSDGAIDAEGAAVGPPLITVQNSDIVNGKLYLMDSDVGIIRDNVFRRTTIYGGAAPKMISLNGAGTPPGSGTLKIHRNTFIDAVWGSSPPSLNVRMIDATRDAYQGALSIEDNDFFYSNRLTSGTTAQKCLIDVTATSTNTNNPPFGPVRIRGNRFGCIENGGTALNSLVHLGYSGNPSATTFDEIYLEDLSEIASGSVATQNIPATVAHSYTNGVQFGNAAVTSKFGNIWADRCRFPSATTPFVTAGTVNVITRRFSRTLPVNAADTITPTASPFTYTQGTTNLTTLAAPAWDSGTVIVNGANVGTTGSFTLNGKNVVPPNTNSVLGYLVFHLRATDALVLTYQGTGAAAGTWNYAPDQ